MDGKLRHRGRPATVLLVLLLFAAPLAADAQHFVCRPIVRGDTVSRLARQLTGNARAAYTYAFQIRDPARQMFVPKSQYRRPLRTQWEACVATEPVDAPLAYAPIVAEVGRADAREASWAAAGARPASAVIPAALTLPAPPLPGPSDRSPPSVALIATIGSVVVAMLLIGAGFGGSLTPRPIPAVLQRAGDEFVVAFARPLIDSSSSVPPIQARLRFIQHAQELEISIAPGDGRKYPNLGDHKRNVEYDVKRVMRIIGTHVVVSGRLRATGRWVVVPIRLSPEQTGAQ